mmetsp:Transcript_31702/g.73284  ORF Transcript_31702/g.73284 Transcript_31702/m.73284 type:complete len:293 (-) Transcript_31702:234-1112(-)
MHGKDLDGKWVQLDPHAEDHTDKVADVRDDHEQHARELELAPDGDEAHGHHHLVEGHPEVAAAARVRVRAAVRHDVKLAARGRARVERGVAQDETVRVVVDVAEADAVLAVAENPEQALTRRLEHIREEEVVARAVDLVRRDGHRHELSRVGPRHRDLRHGLGLGVVLEVLLLWNGWHLILGQPVDVRSVEACRRRRREDELLAAVVLARVDHVERALVVYLVVHLLGVVRPHRGRVVPDAIGTADDTEDVVAVRDITLHVLDLLTIPRVGGLGRNVERDDLLSAALHQHLH